MSLAKIVSVETPPELYEIRGANGARVHGYFDLRDSAGSTITKGMRFRQTSTEHSAFTAGYLLSIGSTVGMVVADTQDLANQGAELMSAAIGYSLECPRLPAPLSGAIYTIDEAIEKEVQLVARRAELIAALESLSDEDLSAEAFRWGVESDKIQLADNNARKAGLEAIYNDM